MSTGAMDVNDSAKGAGWPAPYRASWVDALSNWVNGRPGQSWAYYLALAVLLFALQSAILLTERERAAGSFVRLHAFIALAIPFFLALFNHLDARAGAALDTLRPLLKSSGETFLELRYRLTTLPGRPTLLAGLVMLLMVWLSEWLGGPFYPEELAGLPLSTGLFRFLYLILWWLLGTFLYHTFHQLQMIDHIYTVHTQINLFRASPFYAFSILSAITAGSLGVIVYGWLLVNQETMPLDDPFVFVWVTVILLAAVLTFLWPQLGMHRLQVGEQERLLDEAYLRLENTIAELHRQLDQGEYGAAQELNVAITSLENEVKAIKGIRTWPWEPETLRVLVTSLALPLGLWLIQLILEQFLGA